MCVEDDMIIMHVVEGTLWRREEKIIRSFVSCCLAFSRLAFVSMWLAGVAPHACMH